MGRLAIYQTLYITVLLSNALLRVARVIYCRLSISISPCIHFIMTTRFSTRFSLNIEMTMLTREGTAEPVSRDQTLRRERGKGNVRFPCSAGNEQDWQPYPVDP